MPWLTENAQWLALLLAWPLLWALSRLLVTLNYLRLRVVPRPFTAVTADAVPPEPRAVLDAMQPELAALGFARVAYVRTGIGVHTVPALDAWGDLYRHTSGAAFAFATPTVGGRGRAFGIVDWWSPRADGQTCLGLNWRAHELVTTPPSITVIDTEQPDTAASWRAFSERLADATAPAVDDALELLRRMARLADSELGEHLVASGRGRPAAEGGWHLGWREAYRLAVSAQRGMRRAEQPLPKPAPTTTQANEPPVDTAQVRQIADALTFDQYLAVQAGISAGVNKQRTFWITAALFMVVGGWLFTWQLAALLLAIIALHEGGHWLAMRWAGYQRQTVFFVPGLGGMATGEKPDATPLEKVLVYLAGPVPGIVLALVATLALGFTQSTPPGWVMQGIALLVFVNLFNLLPLPPLDGGRVLEAMVFSRLPALRLVVAVGGVAALGALAWFSRDALMTGLAVVLLISLPWQWRAMRLERAVLRAGRGLPPAVLDTPGALRRLAVALQQPAFSGWSFVRRFQAARMLLPVVQGRAPRWPEVLAGLAMYMGAVALPFAAALSAWQWAPQAVQWAPSILSSLGSESYERLTPEESTQRSIANADDLLRNLGSLPVPEQLQRLDAAASLLDSDDHPATHARVRALRQQAWRLVVSRPPSDPLRAEALLELSRSAASAEERWALRQRMVRELVHAPGEAAPQLASALEALATEPPPGQSELERLRLLHHAVTLRSQQSASDDSDYPMVDFELRHSRQLFARALDAAGHAAAAETQLRANVAKLDAVVARVEMRPESARYGNWQASFRSDEENQLAWFLIDHGRAAEAATVAARAAAQLRQSASDDEGWRRRETARVALFAAIETGDTAGTRAHLQALRAATRGSEPRWRLSKDSPLDFSTARDQLVAAQTLGDNALRDEAIQALRERLGSGSAVGQCRPSDLCRVSAQPTLSNDWQGRARARMAAAARAQGLCGSALPTT